MVRKSSRAATKTAGDDQEKSEKTKSRAQRTRRSKKTEAHSDSSEEEYFARPTKSRASRNLEESLRASTRASRSSRKYTPVTEETETTVQIHEQPPEVEEIKSTFEEQDTTSKLDTTNESEENDISEQTKYSETTSTTSDQDNAEKNEENEKIEEAPEIIQEGSTTTLNEEDSKFDEGKDVRGKGKSKGKHNSKLENSSNQIDYEPQSQSDISENVQVTPVSPTRYDIPVDNDEPVTASAESDVQKLPQYQSESEPTMETCNDDIEQNQLTDNITNIEKKSEPVQEDIDNNISVIEKMETNAEELHDEIIQQENETKVVDEDIKTTESSSNEIDKNDKVNSDADAEHKDVCNLQPNPGISPRTRRTKTTIKLHRPVIDNEALEKEAEINDNASKSHQENGQEAEAKTVQQYVSKEESDDDDHNKTKEKTEEEISDRDSESSTEPGEIPKEKLKLKRNVDEETEKPDRVDVLKRWGESTEDFDSITKNFNLTCISTEDLNNMCSNLELMDESDVKLDVIERITLQQTKKTTERKVSIEHSGSSERPQYETQNSENSYKSDDQSPEFEENIIAINRKISIVDDSASKLRPPPSPAKNSISPILYITNLVRPFTLKQLKEMLERTGTIRENGLWTDRIKSKCYVHYETEEEAEATRNAIHGVNWPIGNGKRLVIDYATPEEMEAAQNPPAPVQIQPPPDPEPEVPPEKENMEPIIKRQKALSESEHKEKERRKSESHHVREWDVGKERMRRDRSRSRSRSRDRSDRRRHRRTPSPSEDFISRKQKKMEETVPQKLMDDLFQKTKAMPSIFWQPLSPEEISMKQQQRLQRMAEHKRRMEETTQRNRADFGRSGPIRRRYD